jgi:DNA-binding MarR family transcriptional regulator
MSATQLFDRLLAVSALLQDDQERELGGMGLTLARTHLLWVLHHQGPSTQVDLAHAMEVTPRNVTALVDALIATGFVTRSPHPSDRRAVLVALTDRGTSTMTTMARQRTDLARALVKGLPPATLTAGIEALDHVYARLAELIASAHPRKEGSSS